MPASIPPLVIMDDVAERLRTSPIRNYDALFLLDMVEALLKEVRDWACVECDERVSGGRRPAGGWKCPCGGYRMPQRWAENIRLACDNQALLQTLTQRLERVEILEKELAILQGKTGMPDDGLNGGADDQQ